MPKINVTVETPISNSIRAAQIGAMFDVPPAKKARQQWQGDFPIDARPWNVGLIVGPSGCGKSTILRDQFAEPAELEWSGASVIDDFAPSRSIEEIATICQSVGFNTIPAWLRPYGVLSNGEKFRVEMARRLLEGGDLVTMDEFTSVVDRQVAQIGSHAVQKWARRGGHQFVAATCHFDLEDWLQPDWVLEPATMSFRWRSVQRRPELKCSISRVGYEWWKIFARFHYLTAEMHRSARCYLLRVDGRPAAFVSVLYRPHPKVANIYGGCRCVTLPDYQGLGLAFALVDRIGAAHKAMRKRLRVYPAHPAFIRAFDRSPAWAMTTRPGLRSSNAKQTARQEVEVGAMGGRPCAVFEYCGPAMDRATAERLL